MVHRGILALGMTMMAPFAAVHAKTVTLAMDVVVDQVSPDEKMFQVGTIDRCRIAYDDTQIDPKTKKVTITYIAHYLGGKWAATEPTRTSTLDLSSQPYKLEFAASVHHGRPLVVLFEADTQRMAMLSRPDFRAQIAGNYTIHPKPLTEAEVAAPPPKVDPDKAPKAPPGMRPE